LLLLLFFLCAAQAHAATFWVGLISYHNQSKESGSTNLRSSPQVKLCPYASDSLQTSYLNPTRQLRNVGLYESPQFQAQLLLYR
jgi:hypothetical protein